MVTTRQLYKLLAHRSALGVAGRKEELDNTPIKRGPGVLPIFEGLDPGFIGSAAAHHAVNQPTAATPCDLYDAFAVGMKVEVLDLPPVGLHTGVLQCLQRLLPQQRTLLSIKDVLFVTCTRELVVRRQLQQLEYEPTLVAPAVL